MSHHAPRLEDAVMTRRELLSRSGMGIGALALGDACWPNRDLHGTAEARAADTGVGLTPSGRAVPAIGSANPLLPKAAHLRARSKRVVQLFMNGGPSHVDTFDPKPTLDRYNGKPVPTNLPTERKTGAAMGSPFRFKKYGQSGIEVSDLFAHTGGMIDDICVILIDARRRPQSRTLAHAHELRRGPPGPALASAHGCFMGSGTEKPKFTRSSS